MDFISENWRDIQRYYQNTYVKLSGYGDTLFYIGSVNSHKVTGKTQDDNYFEIELHDHQPFSVDYTLPHKAVFQFNKRAVLLQRIPAKQFKRGICPDNVSVSFTDTGTPLDLSIEILKAYTTKAQYRSFNEAFHTKGSKELSYALTPRMSCNRNSGSIYIDTTRVAAYERATNSIRMFNEKFRPEIIQHIAMYQDNIGIL